MKGTEYISIIPGNINYASPLSQDWYRTSVAHNTVVLNHTEQNFSSAQCIAFGQENKTEYAITRTDNAYDSVHFVRTVALLNPNLVLVVEQLKSDKKNPSLFDIAYHQSGIWRDTTNGEVWDAPNVKGYKYITDAFIVKNQLESYLATKLMSGRTVMISAATNVPMDIITGYGKEFMKKNVPIVIYRMKTNAVVLVYCIALDGQKIKIHFDPLNDSNIKNIPSYNLVKFQLEDIYRNKKNIIINPDKIDLSGLKILNSRAFSIE